MERSSGAIRTACDIHIDGRRGAGRPKLTWKKPTERDCREWKLTTVDPQERSTWRSGVRSAMRVASQLPVKGPTDVTCTLINNLIMMILTVFQSFLEGRFHRQFTNFVQIFADLIF